MHLDRRLPLRVSQSIARGVQQFIRKRKMGPRPTPSPCMNCGYRYAILLGTDVVPDFDTSAMLPPDLVAAFAERMDGICVRCGIYQSYKRFTREQLRAINYAGKDITTSDKGFHEYPVAPDFIDYVNALYFTTRLRNWQQYLSSVRVQPANAFFIRPLFGAAPKFVHDTYAAHVSGADMSEVCLRTTETLLPQFKGFRGAINGMLEGEFLQSGPYDALFVFHTLTHACDVHEMLSQMRSMLTKDGFVVFSHEILRKPFNPFHMIHLSEVQLRAILSRHFGRVDRIDACDDLASYVAEFTEKGDNPDLVAWV